MKPKIGIIMRPEINPNNRNLMTAYKEVVDAVIKHGGIPVGIFPMDIQSFYEQNYENSMPMKEESWEEMKTIIDLCNGIIAQGGSEFYDYDVRAVRYAHENDIPLLGICLGMQTMSCAFDGKMVSIPNLEHKSTENYVHPVTIKSGSKLEQIVGVSALQVNSRHKETVMGTTLEVVAMSPDGLVEAVEDAKKQFFIGVQWHPESMLAYDILMNRLLSHFIDVCKGR